jgi:hypothetical protein
MNKVLARPRVAQLLELLKTRGRQPAQSAARDAVLKPQPFETAATLRAGGYEEPRVFRPWGSLVHW